MQKSATVALISSNRLLLLKRGESAPWNPGRYCLPGGKVEDNESLVETAIRELHEETNIKLSRLELMPLEIKYPTYSKTIFVCNNESLYSVSLNWEHSEYRWASYRDSFAMPLVPGLPATIKTLCHWGYLI